MTVDAQAPLSFGGDVKTVLDSPRSERPPATLEEARNQPGRREQIEAITRRIQTEGIKYVFFQQVSITGRVMGKGVVADFFPQVAQKGYQLVYGATANLFTDRAGNYIGFGPEESELAALADLSTFATLPWDSRVARVYCDCYDTETGELLDADPRQNLKRVVAEFEEELGYSFLIGIEPEMMWLRRGEDGSDPDGVTKPYCYHIHQFEELRPVLLDVVEYGQALGLDMSYGDHEDAPGQLELNLTGQCLSPGIRITPVVTSINASASPGPSITATAMVDPSGDQARREAGRPTGNLFGRFCSATTRRPVPSGAATSTVDRRSDGWSTTNAIRVPSGEKATDVSRLNRIFCGVPPIAGMRYNVAALSPAG